MIRRELALGWVGLSWQWGQSNVRIINRRKAKMDKLGGDRWQSGHRQIEFGKGW